MFDESKCNLDECSTEWILCDQRLPFDGVWVFVRYRDVHSPSGYGCCIASIVRGISEKTRSLMKRGLVPDPLVPSWCLADGTKLCRRSSLFCFGDVFGNNTVPYEWKCHNSSKTLFGQQVYAWKPCEVLSYE